MFKGIKNAINNSITLIDDKIIIWYNLFVYKNEGQI